MLNEELRKKINVDEGYTNSLFYTDQSYDNSVICVDVNGKIVYDYDKMIEEFIDDNYPQDIIAEEKKKDPNFDEVTEAIEWIDYNTIRATPYGSSWGITPVIIQEDYESDEEGKYINLITGEPYNYEDIVYKV